MSYARGGAAGPNASERSPMHVMTPSSLKPSMTGPYPEERVLPGDGRGVYRDAYTLSEE